MMFVTEFLKRCGRLTDLEGTPYENINGACPYTEILFMKAVARSHSVDKTGTVYASDRPDVPAARILVAEVSGMGEWEDNYSPVTSSPVLYCNPGRGYVCRMHESGLTFSGRSGYVYIALPERTSGKFTIVRPVVFRYQEPVRNALRTIFESFSSLQRS